jgi:Fe2+ transport system protein B
MNNEGQWIIMMGFLVSLGIFFLAIIISQSTLVGQTTAEGVLEFPKNDIQDLRNVILDVETFNRTQCLSYAEKCGNITANISQEIQQISLYRKSAIVSYNFSPLSCSPGSGMRDVSMHYDNGVTVYDENNITISC